MEQFISCIVDSDLSELVVSGEPIAEDLAIAWANIFYEYCDLIGTSEVNLKSRLLMEYIQLEKVVVFSTGWVKILRISYSKNIVNALKHVGFDYDFDIEDSERFLKDLKRVESELISMRLRVKLKKIEIDSLQDKDSTKTNVDRKYFKTIFFRINNYAKREAVNGQTTVEDYCAALRDYVEYTKQVSNG